ncbi:MAG: DMT family transporter [Lachnospiraceae bacterium]|nr:DMT family transporter [Lachnospiraceae bacterium]
MRSALSISNIRSDMKNRKLLGNTILIFTSVVWGLGFSWQRVGMESISPITFTAAREIVSAIFIGLLAMIINIKTKPSRMDWEPERLMKRRKNTVAGGICCGIFLVAATLFQQVGIVYTSAGKAGFITAMYMLFVPIFGFVLFKRKNPWVVWLAVFVGIVGMYFLCITGDFTLTKGDALEFVCAMLYSGHILCCDHYVGDADPISMSAIQFVTASVISTVLAFMFEHPGIEGIMLALIPILYCGFVSGGIGYTSQIVGQRFTDPAPASLIMSLEAVFAVLGGALMLRERMTFREKLGCIIMFIAIILVQLPELMSSRRQE